MDIARHNVGDNLQNASSSKPIQPSSTVPTAPAMGLSNGLAFMGKNLHVQTENLGQGGRCIITQVFCNGCVVFSTKSEYQPEGCDSNDFNKMQAMMRKQHIDVIRGIMGEKIRIRDST
jgi:hypothetical protein